MEILPVISNLPGTLGFSSVALPAAAGSYVQLPNIVCDEIILGAGANDVIVAGSATPGSNGLTVKISAAGFSGIRLETGGNASNLWMANATAATAQTVGFKYHAFSRGY